MFDFLGVIASKIVAVVATAIIAVGIVNVPEIPEEPIAAEPQSAEQTVEAENEVDEEESAETEKETVTVKERPRETETKKTEPNEQVATVVQTQTTSDKKEEKPKTFVLPGGAVVDENGNITKIVQEAPKEQGSKTPEPTPTTESQISSETTPEPLEIISVNTSSTWDTMSFEWTTNRVSNSKVFISGDGISSKVYNSESGQSTRHIAHAFGLNGDTNYTYEIEVVIDGEMAKKQGTYSTQQVNEKASLKVTSSCRKIYPGTYCDVEVSYFENGQQKNISAIEVSADDRGLFIESSHPDVTCIGTLAANSDGSQRKGNPLTCGTRPSPRNGKPVALFTYLPSASGTRTITAKANGAIETMNTQGQIPECDGVVRGEGVCQL